MIACYFNACMHSNKLYVPEHLSSSQSLNLDDRWGITDDVATIPFHLSLSSAALRESQNSLHVYSLMFSSSVFLSFLFLPLPTAEFSSPFQRILRCGYTSPEFPFVTMVRIIITHSNCILDSAMKHLVRHMNFVGKVQKFSISSQGLESFFRVLPSRSTSHRHKGRWIRLASAPA